MNTNNRFRWSIGVSLLSLLISLFLLGEYFCAQQPFPIVNEYEFIGVLIALLSIVTTFVLGWQIFNAFELRDKLAEMNELKSQFNRQNELIEELKAKTEHRVFLTWGEDAMNNKKYGSAMYYFIIALSHTLKLQKPINVNKLLKEMKLCNSKVVNKYPVTSEEYDRLVSADKTIKNSFAYSLIKQEYAVAYNAYMQKVEQKQQ